LVFVLIRQFYLEFPILNPLLAHRMLLLTWTQRIGHQSRPRRGKVRWWRSNWKSGINNRDTVWTLCFG
jgi:hypothetical protein